MHLDALDGGLIEPLQVPPDLRPVTGRGGPGHQRHRGRRGHRNPDEEADESAGLAHATARRHAAAAAETSEETPPFTKRWPPPSPPPWGCFAEPLLTGDAWAPRQVTGSSFGPSPRADGPALRLPHSIMAIRRA